MGGAIFRGMRRFRRIISCGSKLDFLGNSFRGKNSASNRFVLGFAIFVPKRAVQKVIPHHIVMCVKLPKLHFRQYGLKIDNDIAVVVQKMIPSEAAGVLFTCHPTTEDPSKMVITGNFGLGEVKLITPRDAKLFFTIYYYRAWYPEKSILIQSFYGKRGTVMFPSKRNKWAKKKIRFTSRIMRKTSMEPKPSTLIAKKRTTIA